MSTDKTGRCLTCHGTGTYSGGPYEPARCWKCDGTGLRPIPKPEAETRIDPTAQTEPLTIGQQIVARYEADPIAEPCELAQAIDAALVAEREAAKHEECANIIKVICGPGGWSGWYEIVEALRHRWPKKETANVE